jgi:glycosyltransferase involved in cell wall biosynthesis
MEVWTMASKPPDVEISAIIPVGARHADIGALYHDYKSALDSLNLRYEVIFVLDGLYPEAAAELHALRARNDSLVVVALTRAFGESTALMAGFERARGRVILTLPAYFQIESGEITKLCDALSEADLAVGRRWPRAGSHFESLRRAAFHTALRWMTGLNFGDLGCGARAMKRRVIEEISLYGDQHRFFAILAHREGFRVREVTVRQSPQDHFEGRYRVREYAHRLLDVITVLFLVRFTKKPLRFFGMIGIGLAGIGALLLGYLIVARLSFGQPLADRPALLLTALLVVLGLQLFAIGLLGELIIFTHGRDLKDYQVETVFRFNETAPEAVQPNTPRSRITS